MGIEQEKGSLRLFESETLKGEDENMFEADFIRVKGPIGIELEEGEFEDEDASKLKEFVENQFEKPEYAAPRDRIWQDRLFFRNNLRVGLELESANVSRCDSLSQDLHVCNFTAGTRESGCYKQEDKRDYDQIRKKFG